ncbi:4-phosphoerythronate dehydrogenase [Bacteriovorax sp. BSW11_IV]|uniref:NAD(P)-dependent oxidoreductase n=1 Tax=Bacteriovorax sp. BSW11_IV TaxID=1353529 RepID=UPI00038A14B5|nr:NAD(P)-dependent oxidoreductase [Bacteriovorax sp. BSW11_IV]EQC44655.1 4-phosphoerythronate dehydrogenase [Bacteriovorax sp. BSW11_IV]
MEKVVPNGQKYKVVRKNVSEYQGANFKQIEKKHLEIIPEIEYHWGEEVTEGNSPLILITTSQTKVEQISEEEYKNTKLLIHPNSGHDNLSYDFIKNAPFPIILGNPIRAHAVTNYILSAVFKHYSSFKKQDEWDANRTWNRHLLNTKKVLLIGYGHIGKLVHQSLGPLVQSMSIYDPEKGYKELEQKDCDLVIVAASLNPTSKYLVDKAFLTSLAKDFVLINPARGPIVNQLDLMEVLTKNKYATAYLDVFEQEPYKKIDFLGMDNIITTSHIAGVYSSLNSEIIKYEFDVISKFIQTCDKIEEFKGFYKELLLQNKIKEDYIL